MKAEVCSTPKGTIYTPTDIVVDGIDVYFIGHSLNRSSIALSYRDRGKDESGQYSQVQTTSSLKKREQRSQLTTMVEGLAIHGDVWFSGGQSAIYRSEDAGVTWRREAVPTDNAILSVVRFEGNLWAAGQYGWIGWRAENEDSWHEIARPDAPAFERVIYGYSAPYTKLAISRLKVIDDRLYAIGQGVWSLTTSEATRELASKVQLVDMTMTSKGTLITVGFDGVVLRREKTSKNWVPVEVEGKFGDDEGFVSVVSVGDRIVLVANRGKQPLRWSEDDGKTYAPLEGVTVKDTPLEKFIAAERSPLRTAVADGHGGVLVSGFQGLLLRVSPEGGLGPWKNPKKFAAAKKASAETSESSTTSNAVPARKKSAAQIREERTPSPSVQKNKDPKQERRFVEEIIASPDDDGPRLIYADWLLEHGDPRGELIQVQCALAAGDPNRPDAPHPDHVELEARARQLIFTHGKQWLAPISQYLYQHYTAGWSRGFLSSVSAIAKFYPGAAEVFAQHPVTALTCQGLKKKSDLDAFAKMPMGNVTWLSLQEQKISPDRVHVLLGERMAKIEVLQLWSNPLGDDGIAAIAKSDMRKLRGLSIPRCEIGDAGLEALAESPILETIELLNFDDNLNTVRGIMAIAKSPHLKSAKHVRAPHIEGAAAALEALKARLKPGFDGKGWEPGMSP